MAREWTVREDVVTIGFVMHRVDCELVESNGPRMWVGCTIESADPPRLCPTCQPNVAVAVDSLTCSECGTPLLEDETGVCAWCEGA